MDAEEGVDTCIRRSSEEALSEHCDQLTGTTRPHTTNLMSATSDPLSPSAPSEPAGPAMLHPAAAPAAAVAAVHFAARYCWLAFSCWLHSQLETLNLWWCGVGASPTMDQHRTTTGS